MLACLSRVKDTRAGAQDMLLKVGYAARGGRTDPGFPASQQTATLSKPPSISEPLFSHGRRGQ